MTNNKVVRLWTIGNLDHKIYGMDDKLKDDILKQIELNKGKNVQDFIFSPLVNLQVFRYDANDEETDIV